MSLHTPGPWGSLGPTIYDRPIIMAGDYEAATPIAVTYGRSSFDEHDANTRLIAAAPELLAALQDIAKYTSETHPDSRDQAQILDENANIARIAIAKATG